MENGGENIPVKEYNVKRHHETNHILQLQDTVQRQTYSPVRKLITQQPASKGTALRHYSTVQAS